LLILFSLTPLVWAAETDALAIEQRIRARHMPHGAIVDPIFRDAESQDILHYTRCGDSAIWTGHYLAAQVFRHAATRSAEALENVHGALEAIRRLLDATGNNLLPRCAFPVESPWAADWISEEQRHGVWRGTVDGRQWLWIGNTSRDQYLGVFFGLTVAWNHMDDESVRNKVRSLTARMLDYLDDRSWFVVMPDGDISTTFAGRPDQRLMMLKLGRRVAPERFESSYSWQSLLLSGGSATAIAWETLDPHGSYFKFNLDHITFYGLMTGGDTGWALANYRGAFRLLRRTTDDHGNAFFDLVERAVGEPDSQRDARIVELLDAWLRRPLRDHFVDLRGRYPACGDDRACDPVPVEQRVPTDFLWQRSPFQLTGGGSGRIESAGIDYILPYWMARFFGIVR
jgi:hypothetical protein